MSFTAVPTTLDLVELERRVLARWRADDVFGESLRRRQGAPEWVFYEGPPTANGRPGIHHVWGRMFKDLFPRFQTMRGRYVARKGGWDCHGLPVELEVEKELGFSGKPQILEYGIEAFNQRCRESVHRYVEDWSALTTRIGMWLDTADAYWTLTNDYIESVWWLFRQMWDRDLIYEGFKVVPYCGRCGTALSSHEVALGYRDVTEDSIYVRFPVVGHDYDLVVWTTTPWTLISNVAAAVAPDVEYVRVRDPEGEGRDLVLARDRVAAVFGDEVEEIAAVPAADLIGSRYEQPFDFLPIEGDAHRVVSADFVALDEGSGIVHLAPAFGEIDRQVAEREGFSVLNPVGPDARFDASVAPFAGRFVKDADPEIIEALRARGRLVRVETYTHAYPHCWRCDTPLVYWGKPTWFARTSARQADLLRENETIGWHPEHIKHGRFGDWLANNVDWALSRDRFWGTPLPVWRCESCARDTCVGSVSELAELAGHDLDGLDLHRPYVDDVTIACPRCSGRARRVEPVLDAWYDSGAMPSAQFHYPFEHADVFERRFPADFICEAIDQTRGWFYSLLAVNTLVFDRTPYRNVVCHGHIVDRDGQKMSKSRGNVIDPWEILETRGADALRWYFFSAGSPWTSRRVFPEGIDESTRRFLLTLWNTYSFFVTYANIDGWSPRAADRRSEHVLDRWLRSRLHSTVRAVTSALEEFDALRGAQALDGFVDDLSNWYVRRSRGRFWKGADSRAYATLAESLVTVTRLLAPFCPFIADEVHANLTGDPASVHLADWPAVDEPAIDNELDAQMRLTRQVVSLGLAARNEGRLKVRQPLRRALILLPDDVELPVALVDEVADALNVKQVDRVADLQGLIEYRVVPNFRKLGPRVGKLLPALHAALATADGVEVRRALDDAGRFRLEVDGEEIDILSDEIEIRASSHEEFALAQEGALAVALDTALDDELRREGIARELVRVLNEARKTAGFEIADRIRVELRATGDLHEAATTHREAIADEVLAVRLDVGEPDGGAGQIELRVESGPVWVRLEKAADAAA